jgi:hypothetical protein
MVGGAEADWGGGGVREGLVGEFAFFRELAGGGGAAEGPELEVDEGFVFVYCVCYLGRDQIFGVLAPCLLVDRMTKYKRRDTYLLPSRDLLLAPYPRDVGVPTRLWCDKSRLGYEQCPGDATPLSIVFRHERQWDVVLICPKASQRGHNDAVREVDVADLDRLEERWGACGRGHFGSGMIVGGLLLVGGGGGRTTRSLRCSILSLCKTA